MTEPTPTRKRRATLRDLVLGLCLGGAAVAAVWFWYPGFWRQPAISEEQLAREQREAMLAEARKLQAKAAPAPTPPPAGPCTFEPLIPAASARDGHARMEHPFPGGPREKAQVFLRTARKAAAEGRTRDAEVALIATCRMHAEAATKPSLPLANVLARLGAAYVAAATRERQPQLQEQFIARAREVLRLSADIHDQALGPNAQRSVQARERAETLDEQVESADAPPPQADRPPAVAARTQSPPRAAPAAPAPRMQPPASPAAPALVRSDPDLRRLDADLARLFAQAESVSDDPAGLKRRAERARAEREQCADAACLRDWYARRRGELLREF